VVNDLPGELPSVQKLYQDLRGKGLEVLLIDIREDRELVRRTVKERGYVTPVLLDQSGEVSGSGYRVWGPPTVFIVDRQGRLVGRAAGARGWDSQKGRQFMEALLALPATP
jgi:cytochrome c biogenesis protein CcmG/thiol:disulfide interchange protein DsbE